MFPVSAMKAYQNNVADGTRTDQLEQGMIWVGQKGQGKMSTQNFVVICE